ncbi:hypothetical protein [Lysinibacillus xylanilyticus]|uniref:hypothetical protein n=1 Tax=Lysinibacillus xylanilyticus TaxID=582475 RepID=UPI003CFFCD56
MKNMFKGVFGILFLIFCLLYVVSALWFSISYIKTDGQIWTGFSLQSIFMSLLMIAIVLFIPLLIGGIVTGVVMNFLGERVGTFVGFVVMGGCAYCMIAATILSVTGVNIHDYLIKLWTTNLF